MEFHYFDTIELFFNQDNIRNTCIIKLLEILTFKMIL